MTRCNCCSTLVAVMYAPVLCAACEAAGCDLYSEGETHDTDFGPITMVTKHSPCKREAYL